jgi:hypothetical protein
MESATIYKLFCSGYLKRQIRAAFPLAQQTCNRGRLSLLTFFGEAKKVSGRAAMKRKVKR